MKRFFFSAMLALGMSGPLSASNFSDPEILIVGSRSKEFGIMVEDISGPELRIRFIDQSGMILYKETQQGGHFAKRFDLSQLERGSYKLEVEDSEQISTFPVQVTLNKVRVDRGKSEVVIKPQITSNRDRIRVSLPAFNLPVEVFIYTQEGELVHSQEYKDRNYINTLFDLSNLDEDKYRVAVRFHSRSFTETITLQ